MTQTSAFPTSPGSFRWKTGRIPYHTMLLSMERGHKTFVSQTGEWGYRILRGQQEPIKYKRTGETRESILLVLSLPTNFTQHDFL